MVAWDSIENCFIELVERMGLQELLVEFRPQRLVHHSRMSLSKLRKVSFLLILGRPDLHEQDP